MLEYHQYKYAINKYKAEVSQKVMKAPFGDATDDDDWDSLSFNFTHYVEQWKYNRGDKNHQLKEEVLLIFGNI